MKSARNWLFVLLAAVFMLGACGKQGDPIPPSGDDATFPQVYPQR